MIENSQDIKSRRGGITDNKEGSPLFIKSNFSQKNKLNSENQCKKKDRGAVFQERDRRNLAKEMDYNVTNYDDITKKDSNKFIVRVLLLFLGMLLTNLEPFFEFCIYISKYA